MHPRPSLALLLALSAAASLALGADPPSADPDAAADPPPPPCTLAARLAARTDTAAFLALLEARGLGPDIRRADLPPLTLFAPTDAALAASVLPRDATEADGGGDGGGGGAPPGSVAALVASAPAALPIVVGGAFVRGVVGGNELRGGKTMPTLVTDKAVGQADRVVSLRVDGDGTLVSEGGARARVVARDDGRCGGGAPALHVVDAVLLPFKL